MLGVMRGSPSAPGILSAFLAHRSLLFALVRRDFVGRYNGSFLGVAWSLIHPLLMLAIYTFVFSVVFQARWGTGQDGKVAFAVVLFSGMIVHGFFAECLNRAPTLITANPNFVKKVVFPLEILPWSVVLSALLHFSIGFAVLLLFCLLAGMPVQAGAVLVPVILLPLVLLTLGLVWLFASLGVFLRDLAQGMGLLTTVTLFLAPVFYPLERVPTELRGLIHWNPITLPIVQLRELVLWGTPVDWTRWAWSLAIGLGVCALGFLWFQRTRRGFADVL